MKILILITISLSFVLSDILFYTTPKIEKNKYSSRKGFIFKYDKMECLSPVDTSTYTFDLWTDDSEYDAKIDPHFICCKEPFSPDTIIPSLGQQNLTSLDILLQDYIILTKWKTNCSFYYGHWSVATFHLEEPSTLGIHPLTIKTILG